LAWARQLRTDDATGIVIRKRVGALINLRVQKIARNEGRGEDGLKGRVWTYWRPAASFAAAVASLAAAAAISSSHTRSAGLQRGSVAAMDRPSPHMPNVFLISSGCAR
jgi:hypothetical protein